MMFTSQRLRFVLAAGCLCVTLAASRAAVTLYVAPDGNDDWSGRSPRHGHGPGQLRLPRDLPRRHDLRGHRAEQHREPVPETGAKAGSHAAEIKWDQNRSETPLPSRLWLAAEQNALCLAVANDIEPGKRASR